MTFILGSRSRRELQDVHPVLVVVVERAISLTSQDFTVFDGLRTINEQRELVRRGASKTMNSKHLRQRDGYSHAVDLVPYVGGKLRWEWPLIYPIAAAMAKAARQEGLALTWGGVWDRQVAEYGGDAGAMKAAVHAYCVRHPGPDFIDGPHYQVA